MTATTIAYPETHTDRESLPQRDGTRWVRPALLLIAALAAMSYAWGIRTQPPVMFYAAAARSMSMSWHNFFFAAFDPDATISIDKLPAAFWVQALSVRVFGPHDWAYILPQVVEGVLTVLVLFRAVQRVSGPAAGLIAAFVLAVTPATVALNRGNVPDSLLILLLVLAFDRVAVALTSGRLRNLGYAGILVGLAFNAKMVQAWLVVPAVVAAVLYTAPKAELRQRITGTAWFAGSAVAVSLLWVVVVSAIPAGSRPYVDGSRHNSLFEQVFLFNAANRANDSFGVGAGNIAVGDSGVGYRNILVFGPDQRMEHIFAGGGGRAIGWLVPLALICLVGLVFRARGRRTQPQTSALVLWGGSLLVHLVVFQAIGTVSPYYLVSLTPSIAALIGMGAVGFRELADRPAVRWAGIGAVLATIGYGWLLLAPAPREVRWGIGIFALLCVGAGVLGGRWLIALLIGALAAPAAASVAVTADRYGPVDTPFEPLAATVVTQRYSRDAVHQATELLAFVGNSSSSRYPVTTYTSVVAAPFILVSGKQIASIGGFTGTAPAPTVDQIADRVAAGDIGLVLVTESDDERVGWIRHHCGRLLGKGAVTAYRCTPAAAR
ncbi:MULTISPECIES: glycosyltransferase family 39 protein [unclassified Nocardia]|uniref:ArnT family glycosyltransferase n=1 Tax=unclassified Nocardia TaxID=2637762 RepID=UPI001CE4AA06|nr:MULTISPECIES: glycosyltransferase family 39 protein [unclassified Nocardia]